MTVTNKKKKLQQHRRELCHFLDTSHDLALRVGEDRRIVRILFHNLHVEIFAEALEEISAAGGGGGKI